MRYLKLKVGVFDDLILFLISSNNVSLAKLFIASFLEKLKGWVAYISRLYIINNF